ncbi:hypothetical protein [Myxococcus eversor]|uniref:hypothetical protein n=1 Tax=Myxococcus eversor TaxID=2709661 RepID=UPI0013D7060B|nr:hypothetical protein [Myxococcus eversor]
MADCAQPKKGCIVDGCVRPVRVKGLCDTHRKRKARGRPLDARRHRSKDADAETEGWPVITARLASPEMLTFFNGLADARGGSRNDVLREALSVFAASQGYVPPPVPEWVADAVAELREARRRVEESTRRLWEMFERARGDWYADECVPPVGYL